MAGWAILTLPAAAVGAILAFIDSALFPSHYHDTFAFAAALPAFTVSGTFLHCLRLIGIQVARRRPHNVDPQASPLTRAYPDPGPLTRWLLTSRDSDLILQAAMAIVFVALELSLNP